MTRSLGATRAAVSLVACFLLLVPTPSSAANPTSGTVSQTNPVVTWAGQIPSNTSEVGNSSCAGPNDPGCDNFKLTIVPPDASYGPYVVTIQTTSFSSGDWDLQIYDANGKLVGSSGAGNGVTSNEVESVTLFNPPAGTYTVAAAPFAPVPNPTGASYTGTATLKPLQQTVVAPGTEPLSYATYANPNGIGGGEPSIGCNWKTNRVLYEANTKTLRVTFNDCTSPATATWEDKSAPTSVISFDPILFTDSRTGHSVVSHLITPAVVNNLLVLTAGCSLSSVTDDDGDTWVPSQGCGLIAGADHQTVGGGMYHAVNGVAVPNPINAVYYCAQSGIDAYCARSDDGGITYGPSTVPYFSECGGLHGHVKVSPADGTVYFPNRNCEGEQAAVVSEDNGLTWSIRHVPNTYASSMDPSIAVATDGTVYFGYQDNDGHAKTAVSHDKGLTWTNLRDVGAPLGIQNTAFPEMVAGDGTRAAMAFLGTTTAGGFQDAGFTGVWHLYVSHTYDGGNTWTTVDATPNDPVQRGCIWMQGGTNACRNLLDFMDATIDRDGRVLVAFPDGCVGDCVTGTHNSYASLASIARQVNGRRMFAAADVAGVPSAPLVTANIDCANPTQVHLTWSAPDSHGVAITGYTIYRSTDGVTYAPIARVAGNVNEYNDTIASGQNVKYKVTATNSAGESTSCAPVTPTACTPPPPPPDVCKAPGARILTDAAGDALDMQPAHDVLSLNIAEPASLGAGKIMFTLKMASLQTVPPNTTWPVAFTAPAGNFWVRMSNVVTPSNPTGAIKFAYGSGTAVSALIIPTTGALPIDNAGTPADPASGFNADGTITIVIPRSGIGNPASGQQLTSFLTRIRVEGGVQSITPDNMPDSLSGSGVYTIKGSENCNTCAAPTANPDSASTNGGQPVVINVVANDSGGSLTVTHVTQPSNGTASNNADGTVTYNPNNGFSGTDTFTYTIQNGCGATATGTVTVTVISTTCFEDDDAAMAYDNGWHVLSDANASSGHAHLKSGSGPNAMKFTFQLQAAQGSLSYFYATTTKGGSADVYLDGAKVGTVSYSGDSGSMKAPAYGASLQIPVTGSGTHTFELRNVNGPAYVDKICVTSGASSGTQAAAGPGQTSTAITSVSVGTPVTQNLALPPNATGFAVAAESSVAIPYKLVILDGSGNIVSTVNSDSRGIASYQGPATGSALYTVQVVNIGVGPVSIWTAMTPYVTH